MLDLEIDPNVTFLDANKVIEGMCKAHYNAHNMGDARTCTHFLIFMDMVYSH